MTRANCCRLNANMTAEEANSSKCKEHYSARLESVSTDALACSRLPRRAFTSHPIKVVRDSWNCVKHLTLKSPRFTKKKIEKILSTQGDRKLNSILSYTTRRNWVVRTRENPINLPVRLVWLSYLINGETAKSVNIEISQRIWRKYISQSVKKVDDI